MFWMIVKAVLFLCFTVQVITALIKENRGDTLGAVYHITFALLMMVAANG